MVDAGLPGETVTGDIFIGTVDCVWPVADWTNRVLDVVVKGEGFLTLALRIVPLPILAVGTLKQARLISGTTLPESAAVE